VTELVDRENLLPPPTIRSFHPRRSRMTQRSADAIERLWPLFGIDVVDQPLDLSKTFGAGVPVVLEIGSGMGEAAAAIAAADPNAGVLAIDVHTPGLGSLLARVEDAGLTNVRVAQGDAVDLLRDMLAPGSLSGVRIFFPDPWPKARHHKRRLVQPRFIELLVSRVAVGGFVHCATDWADYGQQMLTVLSAEPALVNCHEGFAPRPMSRPYTRFERAGLAKGHQVVDLMFRRV
jgi:tRNA (guanine-N7-)-methyltransferase